MKITSTAPDVFNICELSSAELIAILTSIKREVNPECEGMPLDFNQNLHKDLHAVREKMLQHERIKIRVKNEK